jgi:hypothetical protein
VVSRVDDQSQHLNRIILNQSHVEINLLLENILLDCTADKVSDVARRKKALKFAALQLRL